MIAASGSVVALERADLPTVYIDAAESAGISPELLYALTLAESARSTGNGQIAPWPYTIRSSVWGARYYESKEEAINALRAHRAMHDTCNIDVGIAQINLCWNGHRVDNPEQLFDIETSITVAAEILSENILHTGTEFDQIARYNSWNAVGQQYADRVFSIYDALRAQHGGQQ